MTSNRNPEAPDNNGNDEDMTDADSEMGESYVSGEVEIEALTVDLAEMRDRWMRSEAEIANIRSRAKRDVDEARQFALQKFAGDVVEVAENLRRGLSTLPPDAADEPKSIVGLRAGLSEMERGFISILENNGIKAEDPTGTVFEPNLHQAVGEREVVGELPGTVLQSLGSVWTLNGRLLRPAMVIVAKESATPNPSAPNLNNNETR